jgi:peptidyl-prolyl cis-trans isomerase C
MVRLASGAALALALIGTPVLAQHGGYTHAASPAAGKTGEDPVVAKVDGVEIRRSELIIAAEGLPQQYRQIPMQMLYAPLLNQLIDRKLIAIEADKAKLADDPEIQKRLAVQRERVLQEAFLARELKTKVTDARLKAQYKKTSKDGDRETEVRARHILVDNEAEAKKLSTEAKAGGDFAAMAKAKSKDPGAANGGDLGYFKREQMVPEFATAAFALKPGEISSPVKSPYGWHVIKIEDRRQAAPPSFEASVDELREQVAEEVVTEMLAGLRSKAKVETFTLEGTPTQLETLRPEAPTLVPQQRR